MDWTSPAPAKVNLSLNITGRRADGYHNLTSFTAFASYADQLTVSVERPAGLTVSGPFAAELRGNLADNLITQTKKAVLTAGFKLPNHHVYLEKNIPVSSGLGGGSSDVAAYLRCLADMMALSLADKDRLFSLAGSIGKDVPVCLQPGYQIMEKTGTAVRPAKLKEENLFCVLANPGISVSTASIFNALRDTDFNSDRKPFPKQGELHLEDVLERGNDLYRPAIQACPQITTLLEQMQQSSITSQLLGMGMSGSGASCFALSTSINVTKKLCSELNATGYWAVATRLIS